jgi:hypothetical protein
MIITIFKIRISQLFRLLKGVGLFRIIVLLLLLWFVSFMIYQFMISPENTFITLFVIALSLLSLHTSRKDKHFIKTTIKNPYSMYLSEYLVLVFPFLVIWIVHLNWIGAGLLILFILSIPLISINLKLQNIGSIIKLLINPFSSNLNSNFKVRLPFISNSSFEWISGIRRNLILLLPVYLIILAFSFKAYVASIGMIFISILISSFYYHGEPREFVEFFAKNPSEFIQRKIFINLKQLIIVFAPIIIIAIIFQPHTWYYLTGAIIVSFFIQVLAIIFKYGLFEENTNLNRNSIIVLLNILFVLVPMFFPVPIIMSIKYYKKARKNLKEYYHD